MNELVFDLPAGCATVEDSGVTQSAGTMKLTERIRYTSESVGVDIEPGPCVGKRTKHGSEGDSRVDGQEDIVEDDEELERASRTDPPWLPASASVKLVDQGDRHNVASSNGKWDFHSERIVEGVIVDWERAPEASLFGRRRERRRVTVRWELEEGWRR